MNSNLLLAAEVASNAYEAYSFQDIIGFDIIGSTQWQGGFEAIARRLIEAIAPFGGADEMVGALETKK
jgi:hypothetical protein